jgi:transcriptional regulator with XRE-family HTH domain
MDTVLLKKQGARIGTILKTYREKLRINQSVVAGKASISTSMLSQIERSVVSPSIETLFAVCNALGLDITRLFQSVTEKQQVRVHHPGERLTNKGNGVSYEQLVMHTENMYPAEMFLLDVAPHTKVGMTGSGHDGVEMGYVLHGTAVLVVSDIEYVLRKGDSVLFNASLPHHLENRDSVPFQAVWNALPPHKDYLELV